MYSTNLDIMTVKRKAEEIVRPCKAIKSDDAKETNEHDKSCHLLALPAELRSAVYEYALVEAEQIKVDHNLQQPALLYTCRQIRREAIYHWYLSNTFELDIIDCDPKMDIAFTRHCDVVGMNEGESTVKAVINLLGRKDWSNLVSWCKAVYQDDVFKLRKDDSGDKSWAVVAGAHDIVHRMIDRPWEEVEAALDNLRYVVGKLDRAWA